MKSPRWATAVGALEIVLGVWGLVSVVLAVSASAAAGMRATVSLALVAALAAASCRAGYQLARRDRRGVMPSVWLLLAQSAHAITPMFSWALSLGWSMDIVLYSGGEPGLGAGETFVAFGDPGRPTQLEVNLLAVIPLLALALWHRSALVATRAASGAPAA